MKKFSEVKLYEQFKLKPGGITMIKLGDNRYISPAGTHKMGDMKRRVYEN
jgi:hypothetical protein